MWRKRREEKRDYLNLTWLNHQYYELGRSLQDIADDQGVSMMTISKWVDKIERSISEKKEIKPISSPISKIEDFLRKSIKNCSHCGQKLYLEARFCTNCGKKVEEDQLTPIQSEERPEIITDDQIIPPISKLIKDTSSQKPVTDKPPPKVKKMPPIPGVSEKKEEKVISEVPQVNTEEIQPTPPISKKIDEKLIKEVPKIKIEEKQPVPPVLDVKIDILEKLKVIPYICKFCRMELNKKATFCPQCGTRVKKK